MTQDAIPAGFAPLGGETRFIETIGPVHASGAAPWRFGIATTEAHRNDYGFVEGGLVMALADHAMYLNILHATAIRHVATVSQNTDFLAGARPGEWIEARPEIVRKTRSLVFTKAQVVAGDARLLATATGIWKVVEGKSGGS